MVINICSPDDTISVGGNISVETNRLTLVTELFGAESINWLSGDSQNSFYSTITGRRVFLPTSSFYVVSFWEFTFNWCHWIQSSNLSLSAANWKNQRLVSQRLQPETFLHTADEWVTESKVSEWTPFVWRTHQRMDMQGFQLQSQVHIRELQFTVIHGNSQTHLSLSVFGRWSELEPVSLSLASKNRSTYAGCFSASSWPTV